MISDIDLEVVTPMFSQGAGQEAEFRIPELKSAMRFWWRAFRGISDTRELYAKEGEVFGLVDRGGFRIVPRGGFRIVPRAPLPVETAGAAFDIPRDGNRQARVGIKYLWFQCTEVRKRDGSVAQEGRHAWLKPGTRVRLRFVFRDEEQAVEALTGLWLAEHFGGLGYRSRKGAGAFRVMSITGRPMGTPRFLCEMNPPATSSLVAIKQHYQDGLREVYTCFGNSRSALPSYSAATTNPDFTSFAITKDKAYRSWEQALDDLGAWYQEYREHTGGPINQAAARDLHAYADGSPLPAGRTTVEKASLGLPIVFRFRGSDNLVICEPDSKEFNRRASPLIFHVGKAGDRIYWATMCLMWSEFLPPGVGLALKRKQQLPGRPDRSVGVPANSDYARDFFSFIRDYFDVIRP